MEPVAEVDPGIPSAGIDWAPYQRQRAIEYALSLGFHQDARALVEAAKEIEKYLTGMVTLASTVLPA